MHKIIVTIVLIFLIVSCNSLKSTQKALNSGNYDKAISLSINNLKKNKTKEKNQPYVVTLENAFKKVKDRDEARIDFLKKENRPEKLITIYNLYQQLKNRQEKIKPLLPLKNVQTGKNAMFNMVNYDNELLAAKEKYAAHLYQKALNSFEQGQQNKYKYRTAYKEFQYLEKISPNYRNVRDLISKAHDFGTDYVVVSVRNRTRQIIPRRLEEELLAMDTYGLNNLWTVYHGQNNQRIKYDYRLELNLVEINISPERIHEKEIVREKLIKKGYKYQLNAQGEYVRDSLGNRIKVDKFVKTRCTVYKFTQFKSSTVIGIVQYIDNYSNQIIDKFPLESEFVFEYAYADYKGDTRALDDLLYDLTQLRRVGFPSNEQMLFDTGTDLKEQFKNIISRHKFNR